MRRPGSGPTTWSSSPTPSDWSADCSSRPSISARNKTIAGGNCNSWRASSARSKADFAGSIRIGNYRKNSRALPGLIFHAGGNVTDPDRGNHRRLAGLLQDGPRFGGQQKSHESGCLLRVFRRPRHRRRVSNGIAQIDARRKTDDLDVVPRGNGGGEIIHAGEIG